MPSKEKIYGSTWRDITFDPADLSYHVNFQILRTEVVAIDHPSERCNETDATPDTSSCIMDYIETEAECSVKRLHAQGTVPRTNCNSTEQIKRLKGMVQDFKTYSGNYVSVNRAELKK